MNDFDKTLNQLDYQEDLVKIYGLSQEEVDSRLEKGLVNKSPKKFTRSVEDIVKSNVFTLFNILNLVLATIILLMGDWKNALFIGVAIANTLIGIYQELKFKKTIDQLSILAESKIKVIRSGREVYLSQNQLVLDDIYIVDQGGQIPADGSIIKSQGIEVDESLLTGEADHIPKKKSDPVLSGSFVTSGQAYIRVESVGLDNYANKLALEAKEEKNKKSKLMKTLDKIIRILTFTIVPIGLLLFYSSYSQGIDFRTSVLSATAAMLGMIPEGLILLTSVTFAVGAMNLAKYKTLVQSLPSIETLARVDVLCLDKTGTITDGNLSLKELKLLEEGWKGNMEEAIAQVILALDDNNPTAQALKKLPRPKSQWQTLDKVAFSSDRKWSGASFQSRGSYLLGSPEFLFEKLPEAGLREIESYSEKGLRVLALGHGKEILANKEIPKDLKLIGLVVLEDNLRPNAKETFNFFVEEGVELKVISGDSPLTVSNIASQASIPGSQRYVDMSKIDDDQDFSQLVRNYVVFGRVSPYQKRELVRALKEDNKTVCMTGDGVNDVLALKEADCGVAMAKGSDAARSVADFLLLDHDFSSMVEVLKEGRRVINNIENVSSLYLIKTIYSTILSLLFIYLPFAYPFSPLQMGPINSLTVGLPSFFLALEPNYRKPEGKFLSNVLENAVPAALTVILNILIIQLAGKWFQLDYSETSTMSVLLTGVVGFLLLIKLSKPLNWKKNLMIGLLILGFLGSFIVLGDFFNFESLFTRNVFFYLPLIFLSKNSFKSLNSLVVFLEEKYQQHKSKK